ncbi:site-specific integrase [Larkinella ripae]
MKDGTYPLKLRVTYQRERKYYSVGMNMTETLWADVEDKTKTRRELREIRDRIAEFEVRAEKVFKELTEFTFSGFEARYFVSESDDAKKRALKNDVGNSFNEYISLLKSEGRDGTAESYGNALSSLTAYNKRLRFDEITPDFLKGYEKKMLQAGRSITTVGIYLRALRAMVNQAISEGTIKQEQYPFGKRKYQIPGGRNVKKALTLVEIERIYSYSAIPGSEKEKARDFWLFSYLCNGVNVKDICLLRWKNIEGDTITFIRAKTARTSKANLRSIVCVLSEPALHIIHKWSNPRGNPDDFVFPILSHGLTSDRERTLIKYFTRFVNRWMGKVATELKIEKEVQTYTARHSFATVLKRSGAPNEFISESMGHSDLKTTADYLDSFEDDVKREYAKALLNFKPKADQ